VSTSGGTSTATTSTGGTGAGGNSGSGSTGSGTAVRSAGCGKTPTIKSGENSLSGRKYIIRVPSNYDNTKAYRLIFGFHWMGGTMQDVDTGQTVTRTVWSYYGLQQLDTEKTSIFVAPQGNGNGWGNGGGADLTFVDNMVKAFTEDFCIDTKQIFSMGFSYGGGMSYAIACARAKVFRAVAIYDGGILSGCDGGNDPIAYLESHGVSDGVLGYSAAEGMRDRFVKNNGCTAQKPTAVKAGSQTHTVTDFAGCKAGYPVKWISFDGGHDASPCDGSCINAPADTKGRQTYLPELTWKFFTGLPQN
jgi:poly(3-hydroxybutyrate) depolymerase